MNVTLSASPTTTSICARDTRSRNLYAPATYLVALLGASAAAISSFASPVYAIFIAALVCGWAEVDGLCGSSHVGALTPLRAADNTRRLWRRATLAYTLGGLVTGAVVGFTIGILGAAAKGAGLSASVAFAILSVGALMLSILEIGPFSLSLPQVHRQTDRMWAMRFGFVTGAAMWGSHIGLGFATVIRHGGLFALVGCALLLHPFQSAILLAVFWLGRTLPIWATPLLTSDEHDGDIVTDLLLKHPDAYRICAFAGIACVSVAAAALALASS